MEDSSQHPLLSSDNNHNDDHPHLHSLQSHSPNNTSFTASFAPDAEDIPSITGVGVFYKEFYKEFIKLWFLAGPAIFTLVCQHGLGAITQIFVGHVDSLSLSSFAIENSVIAGFSFGIAVLHQKNLLNYIRFLIECDMLYLFFFFIGNQIVDSLVRFNVENKYRTIKLVTMSYKQATFWVTTLNLFRCQYNLMITLFLLLD